MLASCFTRMTRIAARKSREYKKSDKTIREYEFYEFCELYESFSRTLALRVLRAGTIALGRASGCFSRLRQQQILRVAQDDIWDPHWCAVPKEIVRARWEW